MILYYEESNNSYDESGCLFRENPTENPNMEGQNAGFCFKKMGIGPWKKKEVEWSSHPNVHPPSMVPAPLEQWGVFLASLIYQRVTNNFWQRIINHEWFLCSCADTNWNRDCKAARCFNQAKAGGYNRWLGWTIILDMCHHNWNETRIVVSVCTGGSQCNWDTKMLSNPLGELRMLHRGGLQIGMKWAPTFWRAEVPKTSTQRFQRLPKFHGVMCVTHFSTHFSTQLKGKGLEHPHAKTWVRKLAVPLFCVHRSQQVLVGLGEAFVVS